MLLGCRAGIGPVLSVFRVTAPWLTIAPHTTKHVTKFHRGARSANGEWRSLGDIGTRSENAGDICQPAIGMDVADLGFNGETILLEQKIPVPLAGIISTGISGIRAENYQ